MQDITIIGSGPAGTAAALQCSYLGIKPLVLDVGIEPDSDAIDELPNLYELRKKESAFDLMVGKNYFGLTNFTGDHSKYPLRLTAPRMEYVSKNNNFSSIEEKGFQNISSFSKGGLANAWSSGLYEYNDNDLASFPIQRKDLTKYYNALTKEIGIRGAIDDLAPFFCESDYLSKPIPFSKNCELLYKSYLNKRNNLNRNNFYVGHSRVGVSEKNLPTEEFKNLEFWGDLKDYYTPRYTLEKLESQDKVDYRQGVLVESWEEKENHIEIFCKDVKNNNYFTLKTKYLFLAAGCVNTTKIVLKSTKRFNQPIKILDNPTIRIPLVVLRNFGFPLDTTAFGFVQLNTIWWLEDLKVQTQGTILEVTSPRRAEFFEAFPFSFTDNMKMVKYFLPSLLGMQLYFPGNMTKPSQLSLKTNGELTIEGFPFEIPPIIGRKLPSLLRSIGAWTHQSLIKALPAGASMRYGATLPMKSNPEQFQCCLEGRLTGTNGVYILDSSNFSELPAKNCSFTIMANSMRITENFIRKFIKQN